MLAKSRLNRIENLISQALIDLEVIHEESKIIVNEKEIRMMKSSDELSKEESKKIKAIMNEKSGNV